MNGRLTRAMYAAGLGPLCETGTPPGGDPPANGGGAPVPPTTPPVPPTDERFIPKERFDEVNREYQRLKTAQEKREKDEAEKKGEFEKLTAIEKERADKAEALAQSTARRAAFVSAASGEVADAMAAYKLAQADGLLEAIPVDENGDVDDAKMKTVVETIVKKYEFLKPDKKAPFGGDRGGNTQSPPSDVSKLSAQQKIGYGLDSFMKGRGGSTQAE